MQEEQAQTLAPPEELRPAQLGIVLLGRVILSHISATIVDLDQRGFLRIDQIPGGDDPDWGLTDLRDPAASHSALLRYEATLLDGLFARQPVVRLSEISQTLIPVLNRVRVQLRRDAVRHGRLRRWHRDQRTPRGEQLREQIQVFRQDLRALAASGNPAALAGLVPYAMVFGLSVPSAAADTAVTEAIAPSVCWLRTRLGPLPTRRHDQLKLSGIGSSPGGPPGRSCRM